VPASCTSEACGAHDALSRFVEGRGGGLYRVDFRTVARSNAGHAAALATRAGAVSDGKAAGGGDRGWLVGLTLGIGWVFTTIA